MKGALETIKKLEQKLRDKERELEEQKGLMQKEIERLRDSMSKTSGNLQGELA